MAVERRSLIRCSTDVVRKGSWTVVLVRLRVLAVASTVAATSLMTSSSLPSEPSPHDDCLAKAEQLFGVSPARFPDPGTKGAEHQILPPKRLHYVAPVYPTLAVPRGACQSFTLEALIAPTGDIIDVWRAPGDRPAGSCPEHERALSTAVREWRYAPLLVQHKAVPVCMTIQARIDVK
jgi:hypothetical protein